MPNIDLLHTGVVCLVVTIMYWSGWEMGAVEAISLSILVGSSVDYCVHLVEGYLLAGESLPLHQAEVSSSLPVVLHPFPTCPPCRLAVMPGLRHDGQGDCVLPPSQPGILAT